MTQETRPQDDPSGSVRKLDDSRAGIAADASHADEDVALHVEEA